MKQLNAKELKAVSGAGIGQQMMDYWGATFPRMNKGTAIGSSAPVKRFANAMASYGYWLNKGGI